MTRYDSFILYAFVILLVLRLILPLVALRTRSGQIQPWADLGGRRTPRGKGVTLFVKNRWLMGILYGQHDNGTIIVRTEDGSFVEVQSEDIETVRIYDV